MNGNFLKALIFLLVTTPYTLCAEESDTSVAGLFPENIAAYVDTAFPPQESSEIPILDIVDGAELTGQGLVTVGAATAAWQLNRERAHALAIERSKLAIDIAQRGVARQISAGFGDLIADIQRPLPIEESSIFHFLNERARADGELEVDRIAYVTRMANARVPNELGRRRLVENFVIDLEGRIPTLRGRGEDSRFGVATVHADDSNAVDESGASVRQPRSENRAADVLRDRLHDALHSHPPQIYLEYALRYIAKDYDPEELANMAATHRELTYLESVQVPRLQDILRDPVRLPLRFPGKSLAQIEKMLIDAQNRVEKLRGPQSPLSNAFLADVANHVARITELDKTPGAVGAHYNALRPSPNYPELKTSDLVEAVEHIRDQSFSDVPKIVDRLEIERQRFKKPATPLERGLRLLSVLSAADMTVGVTNAYLGRDYGAATSLQGLWRLGIAIHSNEIPVKLPPLAPYVLPNGTPEVSLPWYYADQEGVRTPASVDGPIKYIDPAKRAD